MTKKAIQEIYYALKTLHFAITDESVVQHGSRAKSTWQAEAFLNGVAIPRSKEVLEKYLKEIEELT
jgi:hypothetical protein